ncbi:uncharacterized protein V6R79_010450 [Siganus canaliculatus]
MLVNKAHPEFIKSSMQLENQELKAACVAEKQQFNKEWHINKDLRQELDQLKDTFKLFETEKKKFKHAHEAEKEQFKKDLQLEIAKKRGLEEILNDSNGTVKRFKAENKKLQSVKAEYIKLQNVHVAV